MILFFQFLFISYFQVETYGEVAFESHTITGDIVNPNAVHAVDLDGDIDVLSASDAGIVVWYENLQINKIIDEKFENHPNIFQFYHNYPNPFNPSTQNEYSISNSSNVELMIYNLSGQKIETLVNKSQNQGNYQVNWDGSISHQAYIYISN